MDFKIVDTEKVDGSGRKHDMVFIPRFNWDSKNGFKSKKPHVAFIVNGKTVDGFFVDKEISGEGLNYDNSLKECAAMNSADNSGWHMLSNAEWGAMALIWMKTKKFPVARKWYEWVSGLMLIDGKIMTSGGEKGHNNFQAAELEFSGKNYFNHPKTSNVMIGVSKQFILKGFSSGTQFAKIKGRAPEWMKQQAMAPFGGANSKYNDSGVWICTKDERVPLRSGYWNNAGHTGVFDLLLYNTRSSSDYKVGFRSALIENL